MSAFHRGRRRRGASNCFAVAGVPQVRTQATNKNGLKSVCGNRINNEQSSKWAAALRNSFCGVPLQAAVNSHPLNDTLWSFSRLTCTYSVTWRLIKAKPDCIPTALPFAVFYLPERRRKARKKCKPTTLRGDRSCEEQCGVQDVGGDGSHLRRGWKHNRTKRNQLKSRSRSSQSWKSWPGVTV